MSKSTNSVPKIYCERYKQHLRSYANAAKHRPLKKVVTSKNFVSTEKSYSTGIINKNNATDKKTTQSDQHFLKTKKEFCDICGDNKIVRKIRSKELKEGSFYNLSAINKITKKPTQTEIKQYYRNTNYQSCDSINTTLMKKVSLNTIVEQSEKVSHSEIDKICSDSDIAFMDPNKQENIEKLKEFRKNNYFECHSAKSRVKSSVANLNHKCVYRFYLNDRLFPVSLNTDYKNQTRCIECNLPLENNSNLTGTIQTKVKLNDELQDMLLVLPVKNSLIVEERRRKEKKEEDCLYFGIIKLDLNGDSMFNRTVPEESLALKYQKGYQEYAKKDKYEYESIKKDDVIVI